jgi:competence protein ComEC
LVTVIVRGSVTASGLTPLLATALIGVAGLFAAGVAGVARFTAGLPGADPPWPEGPFGLLTMVLFSVLTALAVWAAAHLAATIRLVLAAHFKTACVLGRILEGKSMRPGTSRRTGRGLVQPLRRGRLRVCNPNPGRNQQWPLPSRNDPRRRPPIRPRGGM